MIKDANNQMLIVEKYERLINYLYPILQSMTRKHAIARNMILGDLLSAPSQMIVARLNYTLSKKIQNHCASLRPHGQVTLNGAILTILKQNLVWRLYDKD
jgi:hypothetical protein